MSDVKIVIDASTNNIESTFNNVANSLNKLEAEARQTNEALKESSAGLVAKWRDASVSLASTFSLINSGIDKLRKGMAMIGEGADLSEARLNFRAFAASIGQDADAVVSAVRKATKNQVSDADIMKSATHALRLGVTTDLTQLAKLYEIADTKGDMFGQSLEDTFKQITDAIATGNGKALIELGVLPEKFGKASNAADLFKKQGELLNVVLSQSGRDMEALAPVGDTLSDKLNQLNAGVGNVKDSLKMMGADVFAPTVEWLNDSMIPALKDSIDYWREWLGLLEVSRDIYAKFGPAGEIASKAESMSVLKNEIKDLIRLRAELENQKVNDGGTGMLSGLVELRLGTVKTDIEHKKGELKGYEKEYQQLIDKIKNTEKKPGPVTGSGNSLSGGTGGVAGDTNDQLKKFREEVEKTQQAIIDGFGGKAVNSFKNANHLLLNMTAAAGGFAVGLKNGTTEAGKLLEEAEKVSKKFEDINADIAGTIAGAGKNWSKDLASLTPSMAVNGMFSLYSGGIWGAGEEPKLDKIEESLSETIAEAVQTGFANADFSDLSMTLGSILTSVLSKSIAQSNPVMDAGGAINWGNLGANIGVSFATKAITGLFTTKEKNKEAIQQAATIQDKTANAYMDSFETMIGAVYASPEYKNRLKEAQKSFWGAKIGYSWDKDWSWGDLSYVKEYQVNDMGASAAYKKIAEAADNMQTASDNYESELNLKSAQGYDYAVLSAKIDAYKQSLQSVTMGRPQAIWNGTEYKSENLTVLTNEVRSELETMIRELGSATAGRSNAVASGFAKYAPWLEEIFIKSSGNNMLNSVMPGVAGYSANVSSLSRDEYFNAYEGLQNDFADRNISPELLDMVKQSGSGKYELEKLRVTGSDDYAEKYLEYVEKQVSAYEEVMERQDEIFSDAARTFEERSAALATYEAAQESYYQAKLDALAAEQAAEAAIKQKQQEADLRKAEGMEAALSLVGEVAQRGDKIVILQGGDSTAALKTLLEKFQDDPSVAAILTAAISENEAKARWGN